METIDLECLKCGLKAKPFREDFDPPNAILAKSYCSNCVDSDPETFYYDNQGQEILSIDWFLGKEQFIQCDLGDTTCEACQ